jgi:5-oxoprolinase (ATP-hydrolysing) subunit B
MRTDGATDTACPRTRHVLEREGYALSKSSDTYSGVRCYRFGERAVVLECPEPVTFSNQQRIWALATQLEADPRIETVVPGMNNLTVLLRSEASATEEYLTKLPLHWRDVRAVSNKASRLVEIPVRYGGSDGPDLQEVADHTGLDPGTVIARHCSASYNVYFLGFLPGFAYLGGLDPSLTTPRRSDPRVAVPAGSVGIGGLQTGVYPLTAPGGWQIIGRTDCILFDPERQPPTLLQPGDQVRFVASHAES